MHCAIIAHASQDLWDAMRCSRSCADLHLHPGLPSRVNHPGNIATGQQFAADVDTKLATLTTYQLPACQKACCA